MVLEYFLPSMHPFMQPRRSAYPGSVSDIFYEPEVRERRPYSSHHTNTSNSFYDDNDFETYEPTRNPYSNDIFASIFGYPDTRASQPSYDTKQRPRKTTRKPQKAAKPTPKRDTNSTEASGSVDEFPGSRILRKVNVCDCKTETIQVKSGEKDHNLIITAKRPVSTLYGTTLREQRKAIDIPEDVPLVNVRTVLSPSGILYVLALKDYNDVTQKVTNAMDTSSEED